MNGDLRLFWHCCGSETDAWSHKHTHGMIFISSANTAQHSCPWPFTIHANQIDESIYRAQRVRRPVHSQIDWYADLRIRQRYATAISQWYANQRQQPTSSLQSKWNRCQQATHSCAARAHVGPSTIVSVGWERNQRLRPTNDAKNTMHRNQFFGSVLLSTGDAQIFIVSLSPLSRMHPRFVCDDVVWCVCVFRR